MAITQSIALISSISESLQNSPVGAVAQELLVLGVFAASFALWRLISDRVSSKPPSKASKLFGADSAVPATLKSTKVEVRSPSALTLRQRYAGRCSAEVAQPHLRAAEQQMLQMLEGREFTRALNMYRALERDGKDQYFTNEELFSAFIQSAIRVGKVDVVERMLRAIKRNGISPSLKFWQTTLRMISSRKNFSTCCLVYSIFGHQLPIDKVVYSCLINAALENSNAEKAALMLERYGEADLEPKDHVLYFRTYVVLQDVESAEAVFYRLGDQITTLMLNVLLLTCVNTKQPERAHDRLLDCHRLEEGISERIVDTVSYNTVIKGFAQAGQSARCMNCLREMREHNLEPDDVTFGTLLDLCIIGNNMDAATEVTDLLLGGDRPMDTVTCTLLIKGLVRANCLQKAMDLYEDMKTRVDTHPDVITFSVLIKAFIDIHDLQRALSLVQDMKVAGHMPDDIIYTHLLEGCRHQSNRELGKRLFQEMLDTGVKPSDFTLITMVKLLGRVGFHDEARELVAGWEKEHGTKPSVIHFTCLMSGCLRNKNYEAAWQAYILMCEHGVTPDETALATLLPGMVAAQKWDNALMLIKRALKAQPTPIGLPPEAVNSALSQMLMASGHGRHVEELRALMRDAGIPVTARNARRLH